MLEEPKTYTLTEQEMRDLLMAGGMLLHCSNIIDRHRFTTLDQNPQGVRDSLFTYASSVERIAKRVSGVQ